MHTTRDYYEILGISKGSTIDEVKKAYRQLVMKHHPDRVAADKKKEAEVFKEFEEKGEICFADKAQVCMIVLKTKRLVNLALGMLGRTLELSPKPNLDYSCVTAPR